jgi:hypothetical protein
VRQRRALSWLPVLWLVVAAAAMAKVPRDEVDKLGKELTPMGANPAGGANGLIPPYTGTTLGAPRWVSYKGSGTYYANPYPGEKPLFVITGQNYHNHEQYLSEGEIALFEAYPDTFRMPVYPSKRDTRYSDFVLGNVKINAAEAELIGGGNGIIHAFGAIPFPIPQNGEELAYDNQYAPNTFATIGEVAAATVFADGSRAIETRIEERYFEYFDSHVGRGKYSDLAARVLVTWTGPAREKGKIVLVHEYSNLAKSPRNAWQYLPGNRRVRRAPTISYDYPDGPGGLRTVDDALVFNGATDRFTWKIEGSRELFVPYNNNELDNPSHRYKDLLALHHLNPDVMRYELHRCWVLLGELKEGKRHIYGKRRLYMDEDSWAGVLSDNYDRNGSLMRTNMRSMVNLYDMPGMGPRVEIYHDLQQHAYQAVNLINEENGPPKIVGNVWDADYFTPENLRKLGKR